MNKIKFIIVAFVMSAMAAPAFADQQLIDAVIGAAVGGGGTRALYKGNNQSKRNILTAAGALGGAWVGSKVGDDSGRRFEQQQAQRESHFQQSQPMNNGYQGGFSGSSSSSRMVRAVDVSQPSTTWVEEPVRVETQPVYVSSQPVRRVVRPVVSGSCANEEYYRGEFNPEAAQAYCQGRKDAEARRARVVQQAYADGLSGN